MCSVFLEFCITNLQFYISFYKTFNYYRVLTSQETALRANQIKTNLNHHLLITKRKNVKVLKKRRKKLNSKNSKFIKTSFTKKNVILKWIKKYGPSTNYMTHTNIYSKELRFFEVRLCMYIIMKIRYFKLCLKFINNFNFY